MKLSELLKPSDPATLRRKIGEAAAAAEIALTNARANYQNALTVHAEGTISEAALDAAHLALENAKKAFDRAQSTVEALAARDRADAAKSSTNARIERLAKIEQLAASRTKKAAALGRVAKEFSDSYLALVASTQELNDAIREVDSQPDIDGLKLWSTHVETAVRAELFRLGIDWAFSWPYGRVSLPEFMPQFAEAEQVLRTWKDGLHG